jgi:SAM-dependent methyltransferase
MLCAMTDGPFLAPFDLIGEQYDDSFTNRTAQLEAGAWIAEQLPHGGRVLDLGCGSGLPSAMQLDEAGIQVLGTDESEVMLRLARRRAPHSTFLRRDMRDLSDLGEFDAVISFFSLIMLPKADIIALLHDLHNVLVGPKLLAISTVYGNFDDFPVMFLGVSAKATAWPTDELVEVVKQTGYEVLQTDEVQAEAEPGRMERQIFIRARSTL